MSEKLKIGDKVRFLSDVGGGTVSGFKSGNIVLVEDEDGFQIPAPISEVVAIETNKYNFTKRESHIPKIDTPVTTKDGSAPTMPKGGKPAPLSGADYLASKVVRHEGNADEDELDEQLEAKVTRLSMTLQQLELKIQQQEAQLEKQELRLTALENKAYRRKPRF